MYPLQEVDAKEGGGRLVHGGRLIRSLQYMQLCITNIANVISVDAQTNKWANNDCTILCGRVKGAGSRL